MKTEVTVVPVSASTRLVLTRRWDEDSEIGVRIGDGVVTTVRLADLRRAIRDQGAAE